MGIHTITLTTKQLETLVYHLQTDLEEYGCNGSWGDGDGFLKDSFDGYSAKPNARTKRGEQILKKLKESLNK